MEHIVVVPMGHGRLQAPQLPGSVWRLAQKIPVPMPAGTGHAVWPVGHDPQAPLMQTCPAVHARPQEPQFMVSKRVSTQAEPQRVWPEPHAIAAPQRPASHTWPLGQTMPHTPQWFESRCVSVHTPPHTVKPVMHPVIAPHLPAVHT
jgi:hypothetical protein